MGAITAGTAGRASLVVSRQRSRVWSGSGVMVSIFTTRLPLSRAMVTPVAPLTTWQAVTSRRGAMATALPMAKMGLSPCWARTTQMVGESLANRSCGVMAAATLGASDRPMRTGAISAANGRRVLIVMVRAWTRDQENARARRLLRSLRWGSAGQAGQNHHQVGHDHQAKRPGDHAAQRQA